MGFVGGLAGPVLEPSSSAPDEVPEVLGAALVAPAAGRGGPIALGALLAGAAEPADGIFELPWRDIEFHSPEPSPMRKLGAANRRPLARNGGAHFAGVPPKRAQALYELPRSRAQN